MSVDPHPGDQDDPSSLNEYLYTANNPINRIDPDGDKWGKIAIGLGVAALGLGIGIACAGAGGLGAIMLVGALSGGATDAGIAYASGGNIKKAFLSGTLIGGVTSGIGYGISVGVYKYALKKAPEHITRLSKNGLTKSINSRTKEIKKHQEKLKTASKISKKFLKKEISRMKTYNRYAKIIKKFKK